MQEMSTPRLIALIFFLAAMCPTAPAQTAESFGPRGVEEEFHRWQANPTLALAQQDREHSAHQFQRLLGELQRVYPDLSQSEIAWQIKNRYDTFGQRFSLYDYMKAFLNFARSQRAGMDRGGFFQALGQFGYRRVDQIMKSEEGFLHE